MARPQFQRRSAVRPATSLAITITIATATDLAEAIDPDYDPINVWPMPTTVALCGEAAAGVGACHGPHVLGVTSGMVSYRGRGKV
eukprot:SAG31_NODE_17556_length_666_cov_1.440917_1_plen_85_part_00